MNQKLLCVMEQMTWDWETIKKKEEKTTFMT